MSNQTLEARVASLEAQVAKLNEQLKKSNGGAAARTEDPWRNVYGAFAGDPAFVEAMNLGRQWRESFRPKPARNRKVKKNGRARHRSRQSAGASK